jgi:hypothetical protein
MKQAEDVGRRLRALVSSSIVSQLLQRTPPTALTAQQVAELSSCCDVVSHLQAALLEAPSLQTQLVDATLKQQVACSVGTLITWVQQQPEQQLLDSGAVDVAGRQGTTQTTCSDRTAPLWAAGVNLLGHFAVVACEHNAESAGASSLAANLTQQLDQSGRACRRDFKCTA